MRSCQPCSSFEFLEIHVTNENGPALLNLLHDVGIELRCGATCTKLRRIRYGHFDTTHTLVRQQFDTTNILKNIANCALNVHKSILDRSQLSAEA